MGGGVADSDTTGTGANITTAPPLRVTGQGRARWQCGAAPPRTRGLRLVLSQVRIAHGQGQVRDVSGCGRQSKTGELVQPGEDQQLTTKCEVCSRMEFWTRKAERMLSGQRNRTGTTNSLIWGPNGGYTGQCSCLGDIHIVAVRGLGAPDL